MELLPSQRQGSQGPEPVAPGASGEAMQRLHRELQWSLLRHGRLPRALPEGVSPLAGRLAVSCVELLGEERAARVVWGGPQGRVAGARPPERWLRALQRSQLGMMQLGGCLGAEEVLSMGRAALVWGLEPGPGWAAAFPRAAAEALLGECGDRGKDGEWAGKGWSLRCARAGPH